MKIHLYTLTTIFMLTSSLAFARIVIYDPATGRINAILTDNSDTYQYGTAVSSACMPEDSIDPSAYQDLSSCTYDAPSNSVKPLSASTLSSLAAAKTKADTIAQLVSLRRQYFNLVQSAQNETNPDVLAYIASSTASIVSQVQILRQSIK